MGISGSKDFFTNLAHTAYFGSRFPTAAHIAESGSAECLVVTESNGNSYALPSDKEDIVAESPRRGSSTKWQIQRCLVSTANRQSITNSTLRVVAISDTHTKQDFLNMRVPDGDVLVHCGDVLMTSVRYSDNENRRRTVAFNDWLGTLPHKYKIVVPGNHDGFLQRLGVEGAQSLLSNATYLVDAGVNIGGLLFWGTPVSWGHSRNDAFQQQHDEAHISKIPGNVDVLISHGFPFRRLGSFRQKIQEVQPILHFCGHWHAGAGVHFWSNVCTINCSMLNGKYRLAYRPIVAQLAAPRPLQASL